jgi:hypothetical protein
MRDDSQAVPRGSGEASQSPMIGASIELAEMIDGLGETISKLEARLQTVSRPVDSRPENPGPEPTSGPASRIVMDLTSYAGSVRRLRRQVSSMIDNLDV